MDIDSTEDSIVLSSFKENHFSLHRLCLHGGLCVELATWQEKKDRNKIIKLV